MKKANHTEQRRQPCIECPDQMAVAYEALLVDDAVHDHRAEALDRQEWRS